MKTLLMAPVLLLALLQNPSGQNPAPAQKKDNAPMKADGGPARLTVAADPDLESLLSQMDESSKSFRSAQADFQWDQYQAVVEETDVQKGQIFFRRNGKDLTAAVRVDTPAPKQVVYKDGKVTIYEPRIDQLTEYKEAGKNKAEMETIMRLGFGTGGHELLKSFEVRLEGWETVDGKKTARLNLVPKDEKFRSMFSRVILWIDPERDLSLKQQLFEPSKDYRLSHYTNIQFNGKVPDEAFQIKRKH